MVRIDLHVHTTASDGSQTPTEVLALAHEAKVTALAITDHDTVGGVAEALAAGENLGIEVIPGIELSSRYDGRDVHILGYFLDWQDPLFQVELDRLQHTREIRNSQIVQRLRELGLDVTDEEVKELAGAASIGRPHIARVLMKKGYVKTAKEAFDRYLADGAAANVPRVLPEPAEAIALIRQFKGVPVLAHPSWLDRGAVRLDKVCEKLKGEGLMGVEVHYSTHRPEDTRRYLDTAKRFGLLVTGGSDFHGVTKPDIEVGVGRGSLRVAPELLTPLKETALRGGATVA